MRATEILGALRARGIEVRASHGAIQYRPRRLPRDLESVLQAHRNEVHALLMDAKQAEVRWRVEAMLPQVRPYGRPILGLLTARDGAWPADGQHCVSCGDRLGADAARSWLLGFSVRCEFCRDAALLAIERGRAAR